MEHIENNSVKSTKIWNACGYVRLSREDGDREESNSVTGQKDLIRDYFSRHPELLECGMRVDDGFSGSSFERPAFQAMMADVKAGKIDCIVVKDLSRFGRNYLDAGEYIEKIFPFLGIRFIAVNDNYDSLNSNPESDELIIPFKNLINEAYCRDSSIKIRSQLEIKRKRGDFIGSFAVYGYRKDPDDRHRLAVDGFAADVVRDIFRWKLEGVSAADIADRLNKDGILPPVEYKKQQGMRFNTPFRINARSLWHATAILRILKNPVYTGVLEQGRNTTPSYKVKRRVARPRGEWSVTEGAHEAVVTPEDFAAVQKVLALDTRTSPGSSAVELFSGMAACGECGAAMVRKTVPAGGKKYVYYVCAAHKNEKTCYTHSIRDSVLEEIVLESLKKQIHDVISLSELMEMAESVQLQKAGAVKLQERLDRKQAEADRYQRLLLSLYESLMDGMISRQEYREMKKNYAALRSEAETQAEAVREEMCHVLENTVHGCGWMEQFKKYRNITALDRVIVVSLIDRIYIYRDKRVEIKYNWQDEFRWLAGILEQGAVSRTGTDTEGQGTASAGSAGASGRDMACVSGRDAAGQQPGKEAV